MIKFPSYITAILYGAIGIPFFAYVGDVIQKNGNQLLLLIWGIIGFIIPVVICTGDFKYISNEMKKGRSLLGPWVNSQDFKEFYFPTFKRIFVLFISAAISILSIGTIFDKMS